VRSGLARQADTSCLRTQNVLVKREAGEHLDLEDVAHLLRQEDPCVRETVALAAGHLKERYFGRRIVLFAPLYLSNECVNNCLYCGFRRDNAAVPRRTLTASEAVREAEVLAERGFRRVLLVTAEHPAKASVAYLCRVVEAILRETPIREISVNAAPMPTEDFRALRGSGAITYQCFQETYQPRVYGLVHPSGKKREYTWRVDALDRALTAGFRQVGLGVLLGLWDFRGDVLAMVAHARQLLYRRGNLRVVVSLPRFRPAAGATLAEPPVPVSDAEFAYAVAVCRLALPSAEIAISTRERPGFRDELMERGASMMSAGSLTWPGGYSGVSGSGATGQFTIEDSRSVGQVCAALSARGLIPVL
jgi:2-iminoacetate synthase